MVDRFLAWMNVQLLVMRAEAEKLNDGRKKHDIIVRIHELNRIINEYNRVNGS